VGQKNHVGKDFELRNRFFRFSDRTVFRCREVLDNTVGVIKNSTALSACLIDKDRMVLGTEDGLFCVDLDRDEIGRIGDGKKIHQVKKLKNFKKSFKNLKEF
jgi:hypothetical protein